MTALERFGTELLPVGESWCLFQAATRATVLLNREAAGCVDEALSSDTRAKSSRRLKDQLEASGFVLEAPANDGGDASRLHRGTNSVSSHADGRAVWRQTYALASGGQAQLASNDETLAALLRAALAPLATDAATRTGQGHTARLAAERTGESFAVWRDGVRVAAGLTLGDARRIAIEALIMALFPAACVAAILHASGVDTSGKRAVLLAGATGSGKTTLMLRLMARGARLLGDDLIPLAASGKACAAFPTAVSVKSGSWPVVGHDFPELLEELTFRLGPREVRYLPLADHACPAGEPHAPRLLAFPRFEPGAVLDVTRLSPEEALARLLETGTAVVGWPRSVAPLIRLVETTPAIGLRYGDLDTAAGAIASALEAGA